MGVLAGWAYRAAITVNHTPDGAQANYQVKLAIIKGVGANSAGIVYLNNHCANWPTDILFTESDGTTPIVGMWKEESDGTDGTWWLNIDVPAHPDNWTGLIYYGKLDAADESDGVATFDWFENFPGVTLNASNWSDSSGGDAVVNNGLTITASGAGNSYILGKKGFGVNYASRAYLKTLYFNSASYTSILFDFYSIGSYDANGQAYCSPTAGWKGNDFNLDSGTHTTFGPISGVSADTWCIAECLRRGSTSAIYRINGANEVTITADLNVRTDCAPLISVGTATSKITMAWILYRKYTYNEPTWAGSGAEEALGGGGGGTPRPKRIFTIGQKLLAPRTRPIKSLRM